LLKLLLLLVVTLLCNLLLHLLLHGLVRGHMLISLAYHPNPQAVKSQDRPAY